MALSMKNMRTQCVRSSSRCTDNPDSWAYWEKHCTTSLKKVGFDAVPEWRSCFWHPRLKLFLVVYVDDFKMSGPEGNLREGWQLIRSRLTLEDPTPSGKYLGCERRVFDSVVPAEGNFLHGRSPLRAPHP